MSTTLFVRHGTTTWNETGRIQGWAPVSLTEGGREEAAAVADHLAAARDVDGLVTSDLDRAVETAEAIADATGTPIETDSRLRERDFGVFQGLETGSFFDDYPAFDLLENGHDAAVATADSGESWLDVRSRVLDAAADLADRDGTVVAVSHGGPIRLVTGHHRGLDPERALTELAVDNCSITEIGAGSEPDAEGERSLVRSNATPFRE
ncbi:histidine phosphatase family protein [Halorubrum tibetense]|uniref:Histidine phosphatase family protein n=1 Tax=Halorubrum tibetense TaxID=175631 RepID=A0ABD5S7Y1_9EURY